MSLDTAINTHSTKARWRMNLVNSLIIVIIHLPLWDTEKHTVQWDLCHEIWIHISIHVYLQPPESFSYFPKIIFSTEHSSFLEAATLASTNWNSAWSVEFNDFRLRASGLDCHIEWVVWRTTASATVDELLSRCCNLFLTRKILEVWLGDAATSFLEPTPTVMANL